MPHPLLKRAQAEGTPLREGTKATFVWQGRKAPRLAGDWNGWDPAHAQPFKAVAAGVWALTLNFPQDAYLEYVYFSDDERGLDPLNSHQVPNGLGQKNNYFYMPAGAPGPWARARRRLRGALTRQVVVSPGHSLRGEFIGPQREVFFYQPPVEAPCPLLVVFDGGDYVRLGRLPQVVDYLIAQQRLRPLALALLSNGGARVRGVEYACNDATAGFVAHQLVPLARASLNLVDPQAQPGAYGVLGASQGGLIALYTALRYPDLFGHVLSQSGSFGEYELDLVVFDLIRDSARKPLDLWLEIGQYDMADLLAPHQRMCALLEAKGYPVTSREYAGGHNYTAWRNEVGRGLEALFGEPLPPV